MQQTIADLDSRGMERAAFSTPTTSHRMVDEWRLLVLGMLLLDTVAVASAFSIAYLVRFKVGLPFLAMPPSTLHFYSTIIFAAVPVWLIIFAAYRLYDRHYLLGGIREYASVINACTIGMVAVVVASFLDPGLFISRGWLLLAWALSIIAVGAARFTLRRVVYRLRHHGQFMDRTIIVGANEEAKALAEHLSSNPVAGLHIIGAVCDSYPATTALAQGIPVLGRLEDLDALIDSYGARELLVAPSALSREGFLDLYRNFTGRHDVQLRMSSGLFEILTTGVSVKQVGGLPLISPDKIRITGIDAVMKTLLDCAGAIIGLLLVSPLFAIFALSIKFDSSGPVFHRRRVLGRGGNPFFALKFRTMVVNADELLQTDPALRSQFEHGFKLMDDPRITRVGRFLRRTSLDELPQLLNVLLGQMSLVGPRMIAPEEVIRYGKWRLNLLTVKPGITGPWQVNGRNEISYDERVSLSMQYIRNYTIWLDLQILFQTIPVVLRRKGAY